MSKYTALSEPIVDQIVKSHLQKIITAITSKMEPQSIILRGSFGRGEGSVILQNDELSFLSDYEIDVATPSPFFRSTFAELSRQLTTELGVETSIRWVKPDYLYKNRIGPFPAGPAPISISLYESRYGSQTLFGMDIANNSLEIDPRKIHVTSAHKLMLNRMAESLIYLPDTAIEHFNEMQILHWVNKMILACAESLLLVWGNYHFSYRERGNKFSSLPPDQFDFIGDKRFLLLELIARATEFKLMPARKLYPDTLKESWQEVASIYDPVFHCITEKILGFVFNDYEEFPKHYLHFWSNSEFRSPKSRFLTVKLLDVYKHFRCQKMPKGLLLPFSVSQAVYAVVPVMFTALITQPSTTSSEMLEEIRKGLNLIIELESPNPNPDMELEYLRRQTLLAWKNYCYL